MDEAIAQDIRQRMKEAKARKGPPEGFPNLPDIPMKRYLDPEFYELELEHVWRKSWLYVAHKGEFKETGAYKVLDIPFAPVLMVRASDGKVRAFLNSCRHRGAPVVREKCGVAKRLMCQFHAWNYDHYGKLKYVSDERDFPGLVKEERGLIPVRCEEAGNFLFINFDNDAIPLEQYIEPVAKRMSPLLNAPDFTMIDHRSYDVNCNWKSTVDGTLEFYHAPTIHSKSAGAFLDFDATAIQLYKHGHGMMTCPYFDKFLEPGQDRVPDNLGRVEGIDPLFYQSSPNFFVFPNNEMCLEAGSFPFVMIWPTGVTTCRMDVIFFGRDYGDGPLPDYWKTRVERFEMITREDLWNLEPMQQALEAAARMGDKSFTGFPINTQEARIWNFHATIDKMIGHEKIPEDMRVPDLLETMVDE